MASSSCFDRQNDLRLALFAAAHRLKTGQRSFCALRGVLMHGGQGGNALPAGGGVIKADDLYIIGNADALGLQKPHKIQRIEIRCGENDGAVQI